MGQRIRVLIVEDYETDALLYLRELNEGGYSIQFERVESGEQFCEALDRSRWDVIVADFRIPDFGACQALSEMKARGMDAPFVVVSNEYGEEWAVEAMRAGAHDCVRKDALWKLAPIVRRELAAAEARRNRPQLAVHLIWEELDQIVARSEYELRLLADNDRLRPSLEEIRSHAQHVAQSLSSLIPPA